MKHIDIHSHLAWDLDDGISSIEECRKLLEKAKKEQIHEIIATPHLVCGKHTCEDIAFFRKRIEELNALAAKFGIKIHAGSELFINDMLFNQLQNHALLPIENTRYILCEFDVRMKYDLEYELIYDCLYELVLAGYIPVLAHIERYFKHDINITAIKSLVDIGCVIQVNTSSILYPKNTTVKRNITKLLNHDLVHVIATDSHNHTGKRCPNMKECFEVLSKKYNPNQLQILFYKNPLAIISDQKILTTQFKKTKFSVWRLFK